LRVSSKFGCNRIAHAFIDWPNPLNDNRICVTEASMGDLVNLKQFKKRVAREKSEQEAAANRARFGRTRPERELDKARADHARDLVDQHRIDGGDAS
jgi:hypothetical protein